MIKDDMLDGLGEALFLVQKTSKLLLSGELKILKLLIVINSSK
jgi:hypothetical protein